MLQMPFNEWYWCALHFFFVSKIIFVEGMLH